MNSPTTAEVHDENHAKKIPIVSSPLYFLILFLNVGA